LAFAVASAGPAVAQSVDKRQSTKERRKKVEAELNLARASDAKVESEVTRLNQAVGRQEAVLASARQAQSVAGERVGTAAQQLARLEQQSAQAKADLARQAVSAYVHPSGQTPLAFLAAGESLSQVTQRRTLVDLVQGRTTDAIGALRANREDQADVTAQLESARKVETARAKIQAAEAARLIADRGVQQSAHDELNRRIADLQTESKALAAEESRVEALIRQRSQASRGGGNPPVAGAAGPRGGASAAGLIWPVRGTITSEFGPRWGGFHPGLDIADPAGTPIAAAKSGVVISAGPFGGYGNFVVIDHGGGIVTAYAHQSRIAVSDGQQVSQGQVIGYVGSTGFSTGNHLHFEVRIGGSATNPRASLP